jgi:anti-anti-sigma factor
MEINIVEETGRGPVTIFQLNGMLNMGSAPLLESKALQAHQSGAENLLLDLTQVNSLTSAGLRSILNICKLLAKDSPEQVGTEHKHPCVKLYNPNPQIQHVLNIAGFDRFIDIFTDREEAIDSF